jgi:hypothetical protein
MAKRTGFRQYQHGTAVIDTELNVTQTINESLIAVQRSRLRNPEATLVFMSDVQLRRSHSDGTIRKHRLR